MVVSDNVGENKVVSDNRGEKKCVIMGEKQNGE